MGEDCGYREGMEESNILTDWSAMAHLPINEADITALVEVFEHGNRRLRPDQHVEEMGISVHIAIRPL